MHDGCRDPPNYAQEPTDAPPCRNHVTGGSGIPGLSESRCRAAVAELWSASPPEESRSMAVSISGYSVVVRNKTIDERFPGGMPAYTSLCSNQTFCTDGKVTRVSFMTLAD